MTYPDDSIQNLVDTWWEEVENIDYRRGRLIWFFAPHVDIDPYTLVQQGRSEPTQHKEALVKIRSLNIRKINRYPNLPVAALPNFNNEIWAVYRSKIRPGLIVCEGGSKISRDLTKNKAKWQTNRTVIVAPYYGADEGLKRAGFNSVFCERIRRCEYPQFMWEKLPIGSDTSESILRLDHLQPVGRSHDSMRITNFCLNKDALVVLDEWLDWLIKGVYDEKSVFGECRELLLSL